MLCLIYSYQNHLLILLIVELFETIIYYNFLFVYFELHSVSLDSVRAESIILCFLKPLLS